MGSSQTASAASAEFFSFNGVLAIMLLLVLAGKSLDWLLLQQHKEGILARVSTFGNYLRNVRLRQAQIDLVQVLLKFLTTVSVPWTVRKHPSVTGKADSDLEANEILALMIAVTARFAHLPIALVIFGIWALGMLNFRYGSMIVVFAGLLVFKTVAWLLHMTVNFESKETQEHPLPPALIRIGNSRVLGYVDALGTRMLAISFVFSVIAMEVGLSYWTGPQPTAWFTIGGSGPEPAAPLGLALLNLPFDVAALMITIVLLKRALRYGKSVSLAALADIVITVLLCWGLLALVAAWPFSSVSDWQIASITGLELLQRLASFSASTDDALFPLYPMLFTPFVPIAFYLLVPVFLAVVMRPLFVVGSYLCKVFGQKKNSPFFEVASGLALLLGVIKALSDWSWFSGHLSTLAF